MSAPYLSDAVLERLLQRATQITMNGVPLRPNHTTADVESVVRLRALAFPMVWDEVRRNHDRDTRL